jgi:hypothetical protein
MINEKVFKESPGTDSQTREVRGILTRWMGSSTEEPVLVLDTPGIGDTQNRDTKNIAEIGVRLQELGYVNSFLLVLNCEKPRLSEEIQDYLRLYCEVFGENFFEHVMLVFTRFSQSEQSCFTR